MKVLGYSIQRIKSCLTELELIRHSEFPYTDSREALVLLKQLFEDQLHQLESLTEKSNPKVVQQCCTLSVQTIVNYISFLGFIIRSTNVRNGFEVCRPLFRLSKAVLEANATSPLAVHLILSSEWEFSPLTYQEIPALPGFVLIGFPASESANPLIVPLAGHEIGHSLWIVGDFNKKYKTAVQNVIIEMLIEQLDTYNKVFGCAANKDNISTDIFYIESWEPACTWAQRQVEETFCDFIGLLLFGVSYLYAFSYLISPSWGGPRSYRYPSLLTRIDNMVNAASQYGYSVPDGYRSQFDELLPSRESESNKYLSQLADQALLRLIPRVIDDVKQAIDNACVPLPKSDNTEKILSRFKKVIPSERADSLADILNAAWLASEDTNLWRDISPIRENRDIVLQDLVLKSIEVLDIEQTLREGT